MPTAPSPFAALLRRSKFASYDQNIGQVYTTYGGHAFRGDWGFKRPLANRRRTGFITVQSVDSPEQQTEWNSAENSARWMRRWEELGKKLDNDEQGSWGSKVTPISWGFDTEFEAVTPRLSRGGSPELRTDDNIPNAEAMSPKQFQKYLEQLRALRPEFSQFLKDYLRERQEKRRQDGARPQLKSEKEPILLTGSGDVHMLYSAQHAHERLVSEFLRRQAEQELKSSTSTRIQQRPHSMAGLEYTRMSMLQSKYLHDPVPGRHIGTNRSTRYQYADVQYKCHLIAVGGIVGSASGTSNIVPTDFGTREIPRTNRERGKGLFRMSVAELRNPPQTVGNLPQKATDTRFGSIDFRTAQTANLSNPHPLGSPEYVKHINDVAQRNDKHHPIPSNITSNVTTLNRYTPGPSVQIEQKYSSQALLDTLSHMVNPKPPSDPA